MLRKNSLNRAMPSITIDGNVKSRGYEIFYWPWHEKISGYLSILPHAGPHRQGGIDHVMILRDIFNLTRGDT
jgi:hypothetical protein